MAVEDSWHFISFFSFTVIGAESQTFISHMSVHFPGTLNTSLGGLRKALSELLLTVMIKRAEITAKFGSKVQRHLQTDFGWEARNWAHNLSLRKPLLRKHRSSTPLFVFLPLKLL